LLLGYSVEMYLKAGLVKAYSGCPEELLSHDARYKFGHNLAKLASEIEFPDVSESIDDFKLLENLMVESARYPITPNDVANIDAAGRQASFTREAARRSELIWDNDRFRHLSALAARTRKHADRIDRDEDDPAICGCGNIGGTGYWAFRIGGHLKPRVTYRHFDQEAVRKLVENIADFRMRTRWDCCKIYEVNVKKNRNGKE
jgi:hypothetical protein